MGDGPERRRISTRTIPSWLVVVSVAAVVIAVVGFFVSGDPDQTEPVADQQAAATSSGDQDANTKSGGTQKHDKSQRKSKAKKDEPHKGKATKPPVPRAYVEIYNNTQITDLASSTATEVQASGWKVVGTDNWHGNIPTTTIYYPDRLEQQAKQLAEDLGVDRVRPAIEPMKFDRLTLILTGSV